LFSYELIKKRESQAQSKFEDADMKKIMHE